LLAIAFFINIKNKPPAGFFEIKFYIKRILQYRISFWYTSFRIQLLLLSSESTCDAHGNSRFYRNGGIYQTMLYRIPQ
jgi:hypothetical protein